MGDILCQFLWKDIKTTTISLLYVKTLTVQCKMCCGQNVHSMFSGSLIRSTLDKYHLTIWSMSHKITGEIKGSHFFALWQKTSKVAIPILQDGMQRIVYFIPYYWRKILCSAACSNRNTSEWYEAEWYWRNKSCNSSIYISPAGCSSCCTHNRDLYNAVVGVCLSSVFIHSRS